MIMKGGMLMAIRYNSTRFTKDADFSTEERYLQGDEKALLAELIKRIEVANESLPYDTICRYQRSEIRPSKAGAAYPTLTLSIGYAPRSNARLLARLLQGQSPTIVEIDYSYNETVLDVEVLMIGDGKHIKAYSFLSLLAEKFRALLQQPTRQRHRRQDVYDLHLLITNSPALTPIEQHQLIQLLSNTCQSRDIKIHRHALSNAPIKDMSHKGYEALSAEIDAPLPDFNEAYTDLENFFENLPWEALGAEKKT
jgi:predicted nucleotidyltransferase component of viral defense system